MVIFVGIDMAAEARRTGVAVLRDGGGTCSLDDVRIGADDDVLVSAVERADRTGVDVPLGWPAPFAELISAHASNSLSVPESTGSDWRRGLALRAMDLHVWRRTGLKPLSVSTDRIAYPALRWAGLEARLRDSGVDVSRDGSGAIVEVYPAAALRCWSLPHRGYKGRKNSEVRESLMTELTGMIPWLDWNGHQELCVADDNAIDAVLAALVAREAFCGFCEPPPESARNQVRQEGWIWVPNGRCPTAPS